MKGVKRAGCAALTAVFLAAAAGYLALMVAFEGPMRLDMTGRIQTSASDQSIILPWYLRIGTGYDFAVSGVDAEGNRYTKFCYSLPEVFESAEMIVVVQWQAEKVTAFIGESRAMDAAISEFSDVQWN